MNKQTSPETAFLLSEVSRVFGGPVRSSKDFETLSYSISDKTGQQISASTLKRLWGYMSLKPQPRISTLDILAQYTGRAGYRALCLELQQNSGFFAAEEIKSSELSAGECLILQWLPDRKVTLRHLGAGKYEVHDAGTSKLRKGDLCEIREIVKGQPLYIPGIIRDGVRLSEYVAGKQAGITNIEKR